MAKKKQIKVHWKEFPVEKPEAKEAGTEGAPEHTSKTTPALGDPRRCAATSTTTGRQCGRWAIVGGATCPFHGGAAKHVQKKARERIALVAESAVMTIRRLMEDESMPPAIRLRAAMDFLDRSQIAGKTELVVEDKRYERLMEGISRSRPANAAPAPEPRVGGLSRARPSFDPERHIEPAPPGTLALPPAERSVTVGEVLDVVEAELVEERPPVVQGSAMRSFEELYGDVPNPMDPPLYGRSARLGRSEYGT